LANQPRSFAWYELLTTDVAAAGAFYGKVIGWGGKDASTPVGEAMTTDIFSVGPDDFVFEAVRLMGDKQIRRIPVLSEDGRLAGIISMADVALETEDDLEIAETLEEISSGSGFWTKK